MTSSDVMRAAMLSLDSIVVLVLGEPEVRKRQFGALGLAAHHRAAAVELPEREAEDDDAGGPDLEGGQQQGAALLGLAGDHGVHQ
ncbi:hypothetical protein ACFXDE_34495 [Kitasatospora sp. NPDC059408]|uniref:hypothetical protein n=1 Tax=Kitasatospora sp. NPDC059408 TaxID=3346823 RepID=UPI00367EA65D